MNLDTLRCFMTVMEYGSFSKAATVAFTTQSNISKQIGKLERELGVKLFERSNSGVVATAAAVHFQNGLQSVLPAMDALVIQTQRVFHDNILSLRVGLCDSMSVKPVTTILTQLQDMYSRLEIRLESLPQESLYQQLAMGVLDVGFLYSVYPVKLTNLMRRSVTRACPCIYYSKQLKQYQKNSLRIEDFQDATFVRREPVENSRFDPALVLPFVPKKVIYASSMRSLQLYVASGLACAVLGKSQLLFDNVDIATFDLPNSGNDVGTDVVWLADNQNPAIKLLQEALDSVAP